MPRWDGTVHPKDRIAGLIEMSQLLPTCTAAHHKFCDMLQGSQCCCCLNFVRCNLVDGVSCPTFQHQQPAFEHTNTLRKVITAQVQAHPAQEGGFCAITAAAEPSASATPSDTTSADQLQQQKRLRFIALHDHVTYKAMRCTAGCENDAVHQASNSPWTTTLWYAVVHHDSPCKADN